MTTVFSIIQTPFCLKWCLLCPQFSWRPCSQRLNMPITELPNYPKRYKRSATNSENMRKHLRLRNPFKILKIFHDAPHFQFIVRHLYPHFAIRSFAAPLSLCFGELSELKTEFKVSVEFRPVEIRPEFMEFCDFNPWKPSMKLRATSFWKAWILAACCGVLFCVCVCGCLFCLCSCWCHTIPYWPMDIIGYPYIYILYVYIHCKQICQDYHFAAPHEGSLHWLLKSRMLFICQPQAIWIGQVRWMKKSDTMRPALFGNQHTTYCKDIIWTQIMNRSSWTTTRIKRDEEY